MNMGKLTKSGMILIVALVSGAVYADETSEAATTPVDSTSNNSSGFLSGINYSIGGFLRQETAVRSVNFDNPNNQGGNVFENRTVARQAYVPPTLTANLVTWGAVPLPYSDTVKRSDFVPSTSNNFNYVILRGETEIGVKFNENFDLVGRVRGIYQPSVYDEFDARSVANIQGGIQGGDPRLYQGKPDYMDYIVEGGKKPNPLEWTGRNYQIYFPALLLQYHGGDLTVRVGNQQIAWGQSIAFRVFDVPDGLDLRRHLILDRELEEFSDKRVPMLSIRATDQLTDTLLADAYIGKFQPTVFDNPNTPNNILPSQFTIHDMYSADGFDRWNKLSGGIRFKADYGTWGWQAAFVRRYAPDGVFRWTESGVVKPFQGGLLSLGNVVNSLYGLKLPASALGCQGASYNPTLCRMYSNTGEAWAHTPFEPSPAGVYSSNEWFSYAASTRLNAMSAFNAAVNDFPALRDIYQTDVPDAQQLSAALNTDFMAAGGSLRGHIAREYFQENDIMLGGNYVLESENNFLNEMIFNIEGQYIPKRTFTAVDLNTRFTKEDEYTLTMVIDKWHRFFESIPATYIVFEAETKNRSDLVGRLLKGYGGSETQSAKGKGTNATYLVFGFQQPFPNKIWQAEFVSLYDPDGGILAQPGVGWHPGNGIAVEGFYNYINGHMYGNPNSNLLSTLDYAQEFTLRLSWQF